MKTLFEDICENANVIYDNENYSYIKSDDVERFFLQNKNRIELLADLNCLQKIMDKDVYYDFIKWSNDEFANFMLISRENYKNTLNKIITESYEKYGLIAKILLDHIDNFGATKLFYFVTTDILAARIKQEQK